MGCPICGRIYCDHTPAERGQTYEEMMADCSAKELVEKANSTLSAEKKARKKGARKKK